MTATRGDLRGTAALATITAAAVIASFVAGKAARDAIVLQQFDVGVLPWLIGASALLSLPLVLATGRALARFGPTTVIPVLLTASAAGLGAEWLALPFAPRATAIAIHVQLGTMGSVLVSGFWSVVTERFDARVARRHIAQIAAGGTLGGIAGGVIAERTAAYATSAAIVIVIAGLQLACALAVAALGRSPPSVPSNAVRPSLGAVARNRLLRTLAALVVLGSIAATALDVELKAEVAASGHNVLRWLAGYYTIAGTTAALVQLAFGRDLITRFGVPRSIAVLPLGVVAAAGAALAVPALIATAAARGFELVVRSSIYRSAYELLYAPLAEPHKRPAKVIVDVGADRMGDLIGAQLVALIFHVLAAPRPALLGLAGAAGLAGLVCTARLRARYTEALEQSLLLEGRPVARSAGDRSLSSLASPAISERPIEPRVEPHRDPLPERLAELRSSDSERTRRALAVPVAAELVPSVIALLAWDAVAAEAAAVLRAAAAHHTGMLADALLDHERPFAIRRRVAVVLAAGEPRLAAWALWRGLDDPRFEVRYRCSRALAKLRAAGRPLGVPDHAVFAAVTRELACRPVAGPRLLDRDDDGSALDRILARRSSHVLHHVFVLLGLVLPAQTLAIALEAISTDEPRLRATALEYLETVLPGDIQTALWALLDGTPPQPSRDPEHARAALEQAYPSICASLDRLDRPPGSCSS